MAEPPRAFDPATGAWLSDAKPAWDPEGPRRDKWRGLWDAMLALDILTLAAATALSLVPGPEPPPTVADVVLSQGILLFLMGVVPFTWVVATRLGGLHGAMHYLRLERPAASLSLGFGLGVACLLGLWAASYALEASGYTPAPSARLEEVTSLMTWPLALFVAAGAAFGEEVFFRGLLQRRLGLWGQAVLFGAVHANYGTVLQVAVPFALGLLFGYVIQRGGRLWVVIAAHFTFNFLQLAIAIVAAERGLI